MSRRAWALLALALAGCPTVNNARFCDSNTACVDPRFSVCDVASKQCVAGSTEADMSVPAIEDLAMPRDLAQLDLAMPSTDLAVAQDAGEADMVVVDMVVVDMAVVDMAMAACVTSASCPDPSPICDSSSMTCRVCSGAGDHTACAVHNAATPRCKLTGGNQGRCVACNVHTDCPGTTPVCSPEGTCRGCRVHSECASNVCNFTTGVCVGAGSVVYVNNATCDGSPTGTQSDPYCEIAAALGTLSNGTNRIIQVAGSATTYDGNLDITPNAAGATITVSIVGPGKNAPVAATINTTDDNAVQALAQDVNQSTNVGLYGLHLVGGTDASTVFCGTGQSGSITRLTVRDSIVSGSIGIRAGVRATSGCEVTVLSNLIVANTTGISVEGTAKYTILNNFITDNVTRGVLFEDGTVSLGGFLFNTIAYNGSTGVVGGVECGAPATARLIGASIVVSNGTAAGSQFSSSTNCNLQSVVTGTDTIVSAGKITSMPTFVQPAIDLHLRVSDSASVTANQACCIDKISASFPTPTPSPAPTDDIDGLATRPLGAGRDVGADEAL